MIRITIRTDSATKRARLRVKGHAGAAEHGQDIVCAAVSILTFTVAQIVSAMERAGDLVREPVVDLTPGSALIDLQCKEGEGFAEVARLIFFAKTGFALLSARYPDHVALVVADEGGEPHIE